MKEFYEFEQYLQEHSSELLYDTMSKLRDEWNPDLTLSQVDITLITKICHYHTLALLRAYHAWQEENS